MTRRFVMLLGLTLVASACGGGGGGTHHQSTCKPDGTSLGITAANNAFDTDCLAAPADEAFTITFENKDAGTPHNVDVMTLDGDTLFKGELTSGIKTVTYQVKALKPGTYHFHCDAHPDTMEGTFIVQ